MTHFILEFRNGNIFGGGWESRKRQLFQHVCFASSVDAFGVSLGITTWAQEVEGNCRPPLGPGRLGPRRHPQLACGAGLRGGGAWALPSPVALLTGASEARVPCAPVSGGGAHADGLHHVRRLALRAGGLGHTPRQSKSLPSRSPSLGVPNSALTRGLKTD